MRYEFGEYLIDDERFELLQNGSPVDLEPQVFAILVVLIRNQDHLVTNDELLDTIWNGRAVSPSTVT